MRPKIRALIIATKFPNTIQPWLANSTAQVVKQGGNVCIFSMEKGDIKHSAIVDEFKLKKYTEVIHYGGKDKLLTIANNFLNPLNIIKSIRGLLISTRYLSKHKSLTSNIVAALVLAPHFIKRDIDIIHSHFEITGHIMLPVIRAQQKPFIVTFHGFPPLGVAEIPQPMRQELLAHADTILVNTQFAKQRYISVGAPPEKIQIIPQAIVTKDFLFNPKPKPVDTPIEILTVGRLSIDKGHVYALRAIAQLKSKGYKLKYTMLGCGSDQADLESVMTSLGINDEVRILPPASGAPLFQLYAAAHIFILPSIQIENSLCQETQGVVIQEAQASGAIVIATKTGGIPECVEDGKSAFLVEDRNAQAIADKVQWIIDNPHHWSEWQHNARQYVQTHFDIDVIGKRLMQIYADTIIQHQQHHQGKSP